MPKSSTAGIPSECAATASATTSDKLHCHTPGMLATGARALIFSLTNSGSMRSLASSVVSRTMARRTADDQKTAGTLG